MQTQDFTFQFVKSLFLFVKSIKSFNPKTLIVGLMFLSS